MSRNAFATKAGIDPTNLSKMLAGKQKITTATLRKISAAHGISLTWLLTGDGEMYEKAETTRPVVGTLSGDDAKVSGRDMTINPPCTYAVDAVIAEIAAMRKLVEKRDEQIDTLLRLNEAKDRQIQQLIDMLAAK